MHVSIGTKRFQVDERAIAASALLTELRQSTQSGTPELPCDAAAFQAWLRGAGSSQNLTAAEITAVIEA